MYYEFYTTDGNHSPVQRESLTRGEANEILEQQLFDLEKKKTAPADDRGRGWRVWWLPSGYLVVSR